MFCRKLHKNERNWTEEGAHPSHHLDPPMLITARKRSLRRLCFYTCQSVILFTEGCLPQCMMGYTPPPGSRHPLRKQTSPRSRHPPQEADTSPRSRLPPLLSPCWEIRATSRRYVSYWNAYLLALQLVFSLIVHEMISPVECSNSINVSSITIRGDIGLLRKTRMTHLFVYLSWERSPYL